VQQSAILLKKQDESENRDCNDCRDLLHHSNRILAKGHHLDSAFLQILVTGACPCSTHDGA
jgi:cellobiose-specific phosphotransferase system component IIA